MSIQANSNIVLIGMPGSGKSTVGVILAKITAREFIDTDLLIQSAQRRSLQEIIDHSGYLALRAIEAQALLNLNCRNHVIATGGSAAYSRAAMLHLKKKGTIVFLDVGLPVLQARIPNLKTRGIVRRPDQSLADLFRERYGLYTAYADVSVDCSRLTQEEVCEHILKLLNPL